jgi:histidine--tRNA ligase
MNLFKKGLYEMDAVITMIEKITKALNIEIQFLFDPKIIRGLDYYTGTIFEATFDQMPSLGSICGGGRYANLT